MGGGNSESSQTSQQSTASYDQRIANESGIVVGPGGIYTQNFPEQAVSVIDKVLDFTGGALKYAASSVDESQETQKAATLGLIQSNQSIASQAQLGTSSLIKDLLPILAIGAIGLVIFMGFRRGR